MVEYSIVLLLFFFSGLSALVYQVVWQRLLGLFAGAEVVCVTLITAAYMLGMGLGSLAGGAIADKIKGRSSLFFVFAASELIISIFGASSKWLFYDFLYRSVPYLSNSKPLTFITLFCALLIPTFLMGITLPILAKAFVRTIETAVDRIALLYAVNTLGAAFGSVLAATVLIGTLGYEMSLYAGALVSLFCGLCSCAVGYIQLKEPPPTIIVLKTSVVKKADKDLESDRQIKFGVKTWLALSACSGFIALGLEIVWFRLLKVMLKANSITYGWLLFIYLLGLAIGTLLGSRLSKNCRNPAVYFCLCQSLVCIYSVVFVDILIKELGNASYLQVLFEFFARYNPIDFATENIPFQQLFTLFVVIPVGLVIPPTVLMGMSFCFLQKSIQNDMQLIGRRLGWLQAANIGGSTLGALFVGLVSLHFFGTNGTLLLFLALGCAFVFLYLIQAWTSNSGVLLPRAIVSLVLSVGLYMLLSAGFPSSKQLWMKLHGRTAEDLFLVKEDGSGIAALCPNSDTLAAAYVYINGQGHSELPYGLYHSQLGILTLFAHPKPLDLAVIGLGSGETLYACGAHKLTQSITCFEIVKPAFNCIMEWNKQFSYEPVNSLVNDKRIRIVFADGRKGLEREGKKYDIIQQDPLRAFDAGAGMLYSSEYFKMLKRHLKPGGFVVIWSPTLRAKNTFIDAFPYTANFGSTIIGSDQPILADPEKIKQSYSVNRIEGYIEKTNFNEALLDEVLGLYSTNSKNSSIDASDLNHDLLPKDEFLVPQM